MNQKLENQKGEIEFRKKLVRQQVDKEMIFSDEFDAVAMETILADRMKSTHQKMSSLLSKGLPLSPYLEIGAERGQRSLTMENELNLSGAAVDLSFEMLKSCEYYAQRFKQSYLPLRVCCDAYNLPFQSGSLPFVFCYQFLHHFPDPSPIVAEVHRVLRPGGAFYFDEEPFRKILHIGLYRSTKSFSQAALRRGTFRRAFDYFFSHEACNEVEHGVIENDAISLETWKRTLALFEERDVDLMGAHRFPSKLYSPSSFLKHKAVSLIGGTISGLCRKGGKSTETPAPILERLICPDCLSDASESLLFRRENRLLCPSCSRIYPIVEGVVFLIAYQRFEELYPEVFIPLKKH